MQCMKCGRDVEDGQVFCGNCREIMQKYPVKPGTVVQLPHRHQYVPVKKQTGRRKIIPVEEQLALMKRLNRTLAFSLVVLILAVSLLGYFAVTQYMENRDKQALGQNYSVINTEETSLPTEATDLQTAG